MENLRKVEFVIEKNPGYGMFDLNDEERKVVEQNAKTRLGYFHGWTSILLEKTESNEESHYEKKAIVEDDSDGMVYNIDSTNFRFLK
jgi:hypothetical protein